MAARKRVSDSAFWSIYNAGVRDGLARAGSAAAGKKPVAAGKKPAAVKKKPTAQKPTAAAVKKKPAAGAGGSAYAPAAAHKQTLRAHGKRLKNMAK
jgi:hypothetical protein